MKLIRFLHETRRYSFDDEPEPDFPNPMPHVGSDDPRFGDWYDRADEALWDFMPKSGADYASRWKTALQRTGEVSDVPLNKVIGSEPKLYSNHLERLAREGSKKGAPVMYLIDGIYFVADGNHRTVTEFMKKKPTVRALVVDIDALERRAAA